MNIAIEKLSDNKNLIGSASSLDKLLKQARKNFYLDSMVFKEVDNTTWSVHNSNGELVEYIVKLLKGRYRLEYTGEMIDIGNCQNTSLCKCGRCRIN